MNALNSDQVYIEYGEFSLIWKIAITLARISMYQSDYFLFTSLQTFLHGGPIRKCLRFLRTVEMCFFLDSIWLMINTSQSWNLEFSVEIFFGPKIQNSLILILLSFLIQIGFKNSISLSYKFFQKLSFWTKMEGLEQCASKSEENMRPYFTQSSIYSS